MIRIGVRVRGDEAELVLAELLDLATGGVEEVEEGDVIEYAVYGAAGELPDVGRLRAVAAGALVDVVTSEVADDWSERWREFHRPVEVGTRARPLRLRAPWHEPRDGDLVIDPGQAFGTGAHPTTRLCLELMAAIDSAEASGRVLDLGCGSGVLAIAAARLGWGEGAGIVALDHDDLAVDATIENASANGVAVDVGRFDLRDDVVPAAPVVLANLLRPLLLAARYAQPPRLLIASGLLAREGDEVAAHYAAELGLREHRRVEDGGWVALDLRADPR